MVCFGLVWAKNDSIMADRGFLMPDDLESTGVSLNIPAFLKGRDQLTKGEVKTMSETQKKKNSKHIKQKIQDYFEMKVL